MSLGGGASSGSLPSPDALWEVLHSEPKSSWRQWSPQGLGRFNRRTFQRSSNQVSKVAYEEHGDSSNGEAASNSSNLKSEAKPKSSAAQETKMTNDIIASSVSPLVATQPLSFVQAGIPGAAYGGIPVVYQAAGAWGPTVHPHLPLTQMCIPPLNVSPVHQQLCQVAQPPTLAPSLQHQLQPAPTVILYNNPPNALLSGGGAVVPSNQFMPDPVYQTGPTVSHLEYDKAQLQVFLNDTKFCDSYFGELMSQVLNESVTEVLEDLREEYQQCCGWFQSDPEYKVLCSVYKALLEEVVGSEVPSVVSEAIDDLHYNCVQSPRGRYQDVVLGITLDLVSEVVTEETQVETMDVLKEHFCASSVDNLLEEIIHELVSDCYCDHQQSVINQRDREVTELITDYFVGPLLFEESLSLAIEGQADSRLTVENATEDILDEIVFETVLELAVQPQADQGGQ